MVKNKVITLKNGVKIYLYKDNSKHSIYVNLTLKYGGIHSHFKINNKEYHISDGIAHYLEHYLLEHSKYGNIMELLSKKQMICNGSTGMYNTSYYFDTIDNIDYGLDLLIQAINDPLFNAENIEKVKGPIYQEINRSRDNKDRTMMEAAIKNNFHQYTYLNNLGSPEDIEKIDIKTLELCYNTFYQFDNQFLIIAGNFDEKHIQTIVENAYNQITKRKIPFELIKLNESKNIKQEESNYHMPVNKPLIGISYKIDVKKYQKFESLKLANYLGYFTRLNFGITSSLYKTLINNNIINELIKVKTIRYQDYLLFTVYNYTEKPEEFIKSVTTLFKNKDFNYNKEIFELLKKDIKMRVSFRPERLSEMINPFIDNIIYFDYHKFDTIEDVEKENIIEYKKIIDSLDFTNKSIIKINNIDCK